MDDYSLRVQNLRPIVQPSTHCSTSSSISLDSSSVEKHFPELLVTTPTRKIVRYDKLSIVNLSILQKLLKNVDILN